MRLDVRSLDAVTHDLEARRLRIADALRRVMSEPVEAPEPVAQPASEPVSEPKAEPAAELEEEPVATPPVPPLEPFGEMSPVAARALFGDH